MTDYKRLHQRSFREAARFVYVRVSFSKIRIVNTLYVPMAFEIVILNNR